jgi:hypothetical protein
MPVPQPPQNQPWQLFPQPEVLDSLITDVVDSENTGGLYQPEAVGSPQKDIRNFSGQLLVKQTAIAHDKVQRYWANEPVNEDAYNYDIGYSGESNSQPVYVRRYLVRRDQYVPMPKGTNMTGVWQVRVTDGGSGYNPEVPPVVTITPDPTGSGATATAFVDSGGVIRWIRVTAEGTGYQTAPLVSVAAPLSGVTATATAIVQRSVSKAIAGVSVTAGGSGYGGIPPLVVFSAGGDDTATAIAQVIGGVVVGVQVVNAGRDYVLAPGVSFTPQGGGAGATAEATLEDLSLYVVKEDVSQLPADDPRMSLFVLVTRVFETLPGPLLVDWQYDEKLRTWIYVSKRVVATQTVPATALAHPTVTPGTHTEYQSTPNRNRSIQMISSIGATAPASYSFFTRVKYRFPDTLNSAAIALAVVVNNDRDGFLAVDQGVVFNTTEGYAGPCKARVTRYFTFTPNEAFLAGLPAITIFRPEADTVVSGFTFGNANQTIAQLFTWGVPQTLHQAITFDIIPPYAGSGSLVTPTLSATVPPAIPSGYIVADINPSLDERFGLWVYDVIEVLNP